MTIHSSYWYDYDRNDPDRKNLFNSTETHTQQESDEASNKVISSKESDHWPLAVNEYENGTFSIEWDEFHPVTSIFNDWTNEDFLNSIEMSLEMAIEQELLVDTRGTIGITPHEDNYETTN